MTNHINNIRVESGGRTGGKGQYDDVMICIEYEYPLKRIDHMKKSRSTQPLTERSRESTKGSEGKCEATRDYILGGMSDRLFDMIDTDSDGIINRDSVFSGVLDSRLLDIIVIVLQGVFDESNKKGKCDKEMFYRSFIDVNQHISTNDKHALLNALISRDSQVPRQATIDRSYSCESSPFKKKVRLV